MSHMIHCDNEPCQMTTPEDGLNLDWVKVEPISRERHITSHFWAVSRQFCSLKCLGESIAERPQHPR